MSRQGGFEHIQNTLTLLLWSSRQRIILHAILIKLNNSIKVQYLIWSNCIFRDQIKFIFIHE
jgi:hypothetical protein